MHFVWLMQGSQPLFLAKPTQIELPILNDPETVLHGNLIQLM